MKTESLDRLLKEIVEKTDCVGNGLVVYRDGECVYERAEGMALLEEGRAMTVDTLFRIYSVTKVVTAVAGLQLYENGYFTLNTPVGEILPDFKDMVVCETDPRGDTILRPAKDPILMKHLFSQTSGLTSKGYASTSICGQYHKVLFDELQQKTGGKFTLEDMVRTIAQAPLAFEPGTHFHYGNSFEVLARAVEVLTGERFGDYLRKHIFAPLGMDETAFRMADEVLEKRLAGYSKIEDGKPVLQHADADFHMDATFEAASGGLLSTMHDVAKFGSALACGEYNGARILKDETVWLMQQNFLEGEALYDFDTRYRSHGMDFRGYGYGLGVRTLLDPVKAGALATPGEFGWYGMTGNQFLVDPAEGLCAVYLHQTAPFNGKDIFAKLRDTVYASLD